MTDTRTAFAAPPQPIFAADYRPPAWLVPSITLDFQLDAIKTRVRATLSVTRNGAYDTPLRLDGDGLTPLAVRVDGATADYHMEGDTLVIPLTGDAHSVETEVEINPTANT